MEIWDHRARRHSGLALPQIDNALGALEHKTVGKAMQRFGVSVMEDRQKHRVAGQQAPILHACRDKT